MEVSTFTKDPTVVNTIQDIRDHYDGKDFIISDIIDDEGHQYIDLVQEGGGVLGIALLGYTYVLEKMGLRFLNIAGTSAGAVNALLLAACDTPDKEKTVKLLHVLANKNLFDFIDGDSDARDMVKTLTSDKVSWLKLLWKGSQVMDNLFKGLGLNPGDAFHLWLKNQLSTHGIQNIRELERKMNDLPESIRVRKERTNLHAAWRNKRFDIKSRLAIIAAEVNTETKVEFPKMSSLFYRSTHEANPSDFVRASMSIPLFYEPFILENIPRDEESITNWRHLANHKGGPPKRAVFVDGGVMSNFPIDVFHNRGGMPSRPTFGIKLGLERVKNNDIRKVTGLMFNCFDAARNLRDFEFLHENADFKNLVGYIDTKDQDWLEFNVSDDTKLQLFIQGAVAAKAFLKDFNWTDYKSTRRALSTTIYEEDTIEKTMHAIYQIIKNKNQKSHSEETESLKDRIFELRKRLDAKVLWIDDNPEDIDSERKLLEDLGVKSQFASTTEEATHLLKANKGDFDFIISDIARGEEVDAGIQFAKWVSMTYPSLNEKVILYITGLDESRGTPPYVFGITESVAELFHFIIDLHEREIG